MSVRVFEGQGAAELNKAVQVGRVESIGPATIIVSNLPNADDNVNPNLVVSFENEQTEAQIFADTDTAVADEDTGYDGDTSTLVFTGQSLNNTPIIPKSVTVKPTAGGDSVNLIDRDGDGNLYTVDNDEDLAGTIDYFTGALELSFPAGKAPNTTDIDADYSYQDEALVAGGRKNYQIANSLPDESIKVFAATDQATGAKVRTEMVGTWL